MKRKPLIWKLYPTYLLIIVSALAAVMWYTLSHTTEFYYAERTTDLEARAILAGKRIALDIPQAGMESALEGINALCQELGRETLTRITVIRPDGKVICDSEKDPSVMDNHSDRPEISKALTGHTGSSVRYSYTLKRNLMYVAVPLDGDPGLGIVRAALPVSFLDKALSGIRGRLAGGVLIAAFLAAIASFGVSRWLVRPLAELRVGAQRFADGDLSTRLHVPGTEEFAALAEDMNSLASEIQYRIEAAEKRRSELDAIMSSMVEGLIAFDNEDRVIIINEAAVRLLALDTGDVAGRSCQEVIRNADLQAFISQMGSAEGPVETEVHLSGSEGRFLQIHGTVIKDAAGSRTGAMVVLNDITRIRNLERIRRDFVANASHEIRTPVTAIKGSAETLIEGAVQDPEAVEKFLNVICRHSDRLNAIVEDLLSLSRIEEEREKGEIKLIESPLMDVLGEAAHICSVSAELKDITINIECPEHATALIDRALLVQAIVNLIDNAVKYSDPGSQVYVACESTGGQQSVSVRDNGPGISQKHASRIFERFYRVDSSRSRELGGTGLGLAIVKHIAQAHGGDVEVVSVPGKGSTFRMFLQS